MANFIYGPGDLVFIKSHRRKSKTLRWIKELFRSYWIAMFLNVVITVCLIFLSHIVFG